MISASHFLRDEFLVDMLTIYFASTLLPLSTLSKLNGVFARPSCYVIPKWISGQMIEKTSADVQ